MNVDNIVSFKHTNTTMFISVLYVQPPKHSYKSKESHDKPLEVSDGVIMSSH